MEQITSTVPADDLLDGVRAFARFTGFSERRCFYLLQLGALPGGKIGSRWLGSKKAVADYLARIASGQARQGATAADAAETRPAGG